MLRFFFFQAEDGIRDLTVTGVQTCALPISSTAVLEQAPVAPLPAPTSSAMVIFENVTKIYEPDVVALRDITFGVDKGEFVFIVGASGSGKSTLVRLVLKELEPTSGKIIVGGRGPGRLKREKMPRPRPSVGCVF